MRAIADVVVCLRVCVQTGARCTDHAARATNTADLPMFIREPATRCIARHPHSCATEPHVVLELDVTRSQLNTTHHLAFIWTAILQPINCSRPENPCRKGADTVSFCSSAPSFLLTQRQSPFARTYSKDVSKVSESRRNIQPSVSQISPQFRLARHWVCFYALHLAYLCARRWGRHWGRH